MTEISRVIDLLYKCSVGIGVVFVALVTTLPVVWENTELRVLYAEYLQGVTLSLFGATGLMMAFTFRKDGNRTAGKVLAYGSLVGLVMFVFATIYFTWRVGRMAS